MLTSVSLCRLNLKIIKQIYKFSFKWFYLSTDDANSEAYQVETPTSVGMESEPHFAIAMEDDPSQQTENNDG